MTHSPGPFTRKISGLDSWFIRDAKGEFIVIVSRTEMVTETPEPGVRITRDVPRPHADADAALFTAAPALLAAATWAEKVISTGRLGLLVPDDNKALTALREAIKQAEETQP